MGSGVFVGDGGGEMSGEARPTKLYQALLAALGEMGPVLKTATNPGFRSKYADLPSVLDAITPALHKHGLLVLQRLDAFSTEAHALPHLVTELIHAESGESIRSGVVLVSKDPTDPQKFGSALTYYRRYSLLALLGIAPEDDDGNEASQPPRPSAPKPGQGGHFGVDTRPVRQLSRDVPAAQAFDVPVFGPVELRAWAQARGLHDRADLDTAAGQPTKDLMPEAIKVAILARVAVATPAPTIEEQAAQIIAYFTKAVRSEQRQREGLTRLFALSDEVPVLQAWREVMATACHLDYVDEAWQARMVELGRGFGGERVATGEALLVPAGYAG